MDKKPDFPCKPGAPAFPVDSAVEYFVSEDPPDLKGAQSYSGLTKREYFAALAMQGLLSTGKYEHFPTTAEDSISYADALIKELNEDD